MRLFPAAMSAAALSVLLLATVSIPTPPASAQTPTPAAPISGRTPVGMFLRVSNKVAVSPNDIAPKAAHRTVRSLDQFYVGEQVRVPSTRTGDAPTEIVFFATGERWRLPAGSVTRISTPKRWVARGKIKPIPMKSIPASFLGTFILTPGQAGFGPNQGGAVKRFARLNRSSLMCVPPDALRSPGDVAVLRWKDMTAAMDNADAPPSTLSIWEGGAGTPPETALVEPAGDTPLSTMVVTSSQHPVKDVTLQAGKWYRWSVALGDRTAYGTLRLLSEREQRLVADVEQFSRDMEAKAKPDEMPGIRLLLADFYARHELHSDALKTYEVVHTASPGDATVIERIAHLKELLLETLPPTAPASL